MYQALCRNCGREIVVHPMGIWLDRSDEAYCQPQTNPDHPEMVHVPMPASLKGGPEWTGPS